MAAIFSQIIPQSWAVTVVCLLLSSAFFSLLPLICRPRIPKSAPFKVNGIPLFGSTGFFTERAAFLKRGNDASPNGHFSFHYGKHPIVSLSGEGGRETFFNSRGLNINDGLAGLVHPVPEIGSLQEINRSDINALFLRTLRHAVRKDRISDNLHQLITHTQAALVNITSLHPSALVIDPHETMFRLALQGSQRLVGCSDVAKDEALLDTVLHYLDRLGGGSAMFIMFPWLPIPQTLYKLWIGWKWLGIYRKIMQHRKTTGERDQDILQILLDGGHDEFVIGTFLLGFVASAVPNTGNHSAWIVYYLANNPGWQIRVRDEISAVVSRNRHDAKESTREILARLSLNQWETEFPNVNRCVKETTRLHTPPVGFRRNTSGSDIPIAGTMDVIPQGAYAVYLTDDVHQNKTIYADPTKWDPSRYLSENTADQKIDNDFIGWGTGLHPCPGQSVAKLQIITSCVMLLAHYTVILCDKNGKPWKGGLPHNDRNEFPNKPLRNKVYVKCQSSMKS